MSMINYFSKGKNLQLGNVSRNFSNNQIDVKRKNRHEYKRRSRSLGKYRSEKQLSNHQDSNKGHSTSRALIIAPSESMYL